MLNVATPACHLPGFTPGTGHAWTTPLMASSNSSFDLPMLPPETWQDPSALAAAIKAARHGVLVLCGALEAPFASIGILFDSVTPEIGARANAAYNGGGTRLVWKDAYGEGRGGPQVDEKRVIDLSAHRMQQLTSVDPGLGAELGSPLTDSLGFFDGVTASMAPTVLAALAEATGCKDYGTDEARFAYRLVEYGSRAAGGDGAPPRCGSHRDFGTATLIWRDAPGLEVRVGASWQALPQLPASSAVLLFGLCTAWRSNDRLRAAEHRVVDVAGPQGAAGRRLSAVLFMGLSDDAVLSPSLASPGEARKYTTATVGAVHPVVRRKWSWREGSVTAEEAAAEEQERSKYPTQEALIAALYKQV